MGKYGFHPRDVEKVKFAFDVYDFKGDGKVDGFYIGDLLRACNINPTLNTILGNELFRLLPNLGEKLTKEEAKGLMKELCEPEDDEGFMPFMPFLEKMCSNES